MKKRPFEFSDALRARSERVLAVLLNSLAVLVRDVVVVGSMAMLAYLGLSSEGFAIKTIAIALASLALPLYWLGNKHRFRGMQLHARHAAPAILKADSPKILYLRSFRIDDAFGSSLEQDLAKALSPLGSLIAIGMPGEDLPPLGAARHYTSDSQWQEWVTEHLRTARLVLAYPSSTTGLLWELSRSRSVLTPERLLLLLVATPREEYLLVQEQLGEKAGLQLPPFRQTARSSRRRRFHGQPTVSGFFAFDATWRATFLALDAPFWRRDGIDEGDVAKMNHALQPVFRRLGVQWKPSPIHKLRPLGFLLWPAVLLVVLVDHLQRRGIL